MTWPGVTLYVSWLGLMIAYFVTRSYALGIGALIALMAYLAWRWIPQRSRSCDISEGSDSAHKNATD